MSREFVAAMLAIFGACIFSVLDATHVAGEPLHKLSQPKNAAQQLVDDITRQNSDLLMLSVHAEAPADKRLTVVASNLELIGKVDNSSGIGVVRRKMIVLAPNTNGFRKFEIQMPLLDATSKVFGWLDFIYKYDAEPDPATLLTRSLKIRNLFVKKISSSQFLFKQVE